MNETEINWTELTWNPASGCDVVSTECKYCYAKTLAENKRGTKAFPRGFAMTLRPHKLAEPGRIKRPSLIFTNSMTDMFHDEIPDEYRDRIIDVMREHGHHRYQVLTKRPKKARAYFRTRKVPESMWLGVTVGHSSTLWRTDVLREIDAPVRFVSAEPLLSDLDINLDGIHWLISGGESGAHLSDPRILRERALVIRNPGPRVQGDTPFIPREDRIPWVRNLRDRCLDAGVAFWHKQWGGTFPKGGGRMLDGREWDQLPTHIRGAMPAAYVHRARTATLRLPVVG